MRFGFLFTKAGSREGPSPQFMTQTLGVEATSLFFMACSVGGQEGGAGAGPGRLGFLK